MNMQKGYYSTVTEYESGWGCRPDGYIIALTKEAFRDKKERIENLGDHREYSRVDDDPKLCILTEDGYNTIKDVHGGVTWVTSMRFNDLVKEV
jgi:hypothetical protein